MSASEEIKGFDPYLSGALNVLVNWVRESKKNRYCGELDILPRVDIIRHQRTDNSDVIVIYAVINSGQSDVNRFINNYSRYTKENPIWYDIDDYGFKIGDVFQGSDFSYTRMGVTEFFTPSKHIFTFCDIPSFYAKNDNELQQIMNAIDRRVKEKYPDVNICVSKPETSGGCYIATSAYGSYDCPQVWTLRRFRDNFLAKTVAGRVFIKLYYKFSPTLVGLFGKHEWFNASSRAILNRLVKRLNEGGTESTAYIDKKIFK